MSKNLAKTHTAFLEPSVHARKVSPRSVALSLTSRCFGSLLVEALSPIFLIPSENESLTMLSFGILKLSVNLHHSESLLVSSEAIEVTGKMQTGIFFEFALSESV